MVVSRGEAFCEQCHMLVRFARVKEDPASCSIQKAGLPCNRAVLAAAKIMRLIPDDCSSPRRASFGCSRLSDASGGLPWNCVMSVYVAA